MLLPLQVSCVQLQRSIAPAFAADVAAQRADYVFFSPPPARDPWGPRIGAWQLRQRAAQRSVPFTAPSTELPPPVAAQPPRRTPTATSRSLAARYERFLDRHRRDIAEEVLRWVQSESATRFVEDGPIDHWPTLAEMLASGEDDCDGFELLSFHALRQLGFGDDRVYRAILHRPGVGEHHMVTLWFESPSDPWVLDPTATITTRLQRLSELDGWEPLKVFSESQNFTVQRAAP